MLTHQKWCEQTCSRFNERGISERTLVDVANKIELVEDVAEMIDILVRHSIELHILSGSIEQIIRLVLGELYSQFTHVQPNAFRFTGSKLSYIQGTKYDFEGKPLYIDELRAIKKYHPTDILFVGNSSNDRWVSRSGATTLCVNPHFTDGNDEKEWNHCIREMDSALEILKYVRLSDD